MGVSFYLVAYNSELVHYFKLRTGCLGWVREVVVQLLRRLGAHRAYLIGVVAYSNHVIKRHGGIFVDVVTSMVANVYVVFSHHTHGTRVEAVHFHTG
jgi:hypothetical protein